ncbi:cytochrome c biogenesis protein DipZ [Mycobacterium shigaense]|uniref:Protein DipZ n=1 Tax=Mycobacterium shigaense TaxID=722731 RepID=A0A1Z4ECY3_9MYCO|nr:cytochrome c biogenesis protein DipZ [Mycobacterium shigaense]MEA1122305.1 cytochrome c biogenesis protein DipZ [Mycobacterium shigaense]PRI16979.1 thiol:disulfide interchange protein [Mycobacterium shigaense]BAX90831.1 protein DipZ [Mycobacterium shigaense]
MHTIALIGFLGGLITGISPCILPVLPVIFLSGAGGGRGLSSAVRPYLVIAGLVCSFSLATLLGSALLSAFQLPQDAIRWAALVVLTLIGLGLIFPPLQHLIERPFAALPQRQIGRSTDGFGLGLTLGALYVPCAGPVLAAIVVAGGTASLGPAALVLTATFALGNALPLLAFALAGRHVGQRVATFRRRQRQIQIAGGLTMIVLAVALVFNLPAMLQRVVPDYTSAMQNRLATNDIERTLNSERPPPSPATGSALQLSQGGSSDSSLINCTPGDPQLQQCGPAPALTGITGWLNTPDGKPLDAAAVRGKVVLIDFWAYSCINCQRAIPHLVDWYNRYRDNGLVVIGVHTPEYAFERVPGNVASGTAGLHIDYPVALDNDYATWNNFHNLYWPAEYLIDAHGNVRHTKFGEGDYDGTEKLIRQLLLDANPDTRLPAAVNGVDTTPQTMLTPETYLAPEKAGNYGGGGEYKAGGGAFSFPAQLADDKFALRGRWTLDDQGATADSDDAAIRLNYTAKDVFVVVGGSGTVTTTRAGNTTTTPIGGPPTLHQIVADPGAHRDQLDLQVSKGLQVFSFTFG